MMKTMLDYKVWIVMTASATPPIAQATVVKLM